MLNIYKANILNVAALLNFTPRPTQKLADTASLFIIYLEIFFGKNISLLEKQNNIVFYEQTNNNF